MVKDQKPDLNDIPICDDLVEYSIRVVLAMTPRLNDELKARIERDAGEKVREIFGGDRHYISRRKGESKNVRNSQIRRDYKAGERIPLLQRRYGLSVARLWQIINE